MEFRTPYHLKERTTGTSYPGPNGQSKTLQQFARDADINQILARFATTGELLTPVSVGKRTPAVPMFADYADAPSYQEALDLVIESEAMFDELPSSLRKRFGNDPAQLLAFIDNPENYDDAVALGLLPAAPEPVVAPVLTPPTETSQTS